MLCRVVWRPQAAALFSSKPSDRNLPRRTHIKKAKPQPAVDVAKLLEQLFSQRRPGTAPPAAAQPVKASTVSSPSDIPHLSKTNPSVSSVFPAAPIVFKETTSTVNTALLSPQSASSAEPKTPQQPPLGVTQDFYTASASSPTSATIETKVESATEADELTASSVTPLSALIIEETVEKSTRPVATVEPLIETATEISVETNLPTVEELETQASVVEGPVEPTIDVTLNATASKVQTKNTDLEEVGTLYASTVESSVEATIESSADTPLETSESAAAVDEGQVEPIAEAEADKDGVVNILCNAKDAPLIESPVEAGLPTVDAVETRPSAVEGPVEPTVHLTVDYPTQVRAKSVELGVDTISNTTTVEPLLETTIDPSVEASRPLVVTAEPGASVAEGAVETTIDPSVEASPPPVVTPEPGASVAEGAVETTIDPSVEASPPPVVTPEPRASVAEGAVETMIDPSVEASTPPVVTPEARASVAEGAVETTIEAQAVQTNSTDSWFKVPLVATVEPLLETTVEPPVEAVASPLESEAAVVEATVEPTVETEHTAFVQNEQESAVLPLKTKEESTIQSIVESSSGNVAVEEGVNESEHMTLESVTLHSVQASVESLETDELLQTTLSLDERAEIRLRELLSVQTEIGSEHKAENSGGDGGEHLKVLSRWDSLSDDLHELEGETATMVSELLCRVPAELSKTDAAVKKSFAFHQTVGTNGERSQMEEKATEEEDMALVSVTSAEVETEVLQEASDALEEEADVPAKDEKMEVEMAIEDVVFKDTAEAEILTLGSFSEATEVIAEVPVITEAVFGSEQQPPDPLLLELVPQIDQEAEKRSGEQEGSVSEGTPLDSVTMAEVEASLGTLENESLGESSAHLEKDAQVLAGETRVEVEEGTACEERTDALNVESLEADELSADLTDALEEELLFVPGHVAGETETQTGQEVVTANILDDLDPVQRLFLEKIREYNNLRSGEPVEAEPDYERRLSEETAKLQRLYGGGDLSSFPQFTFTEPKMEPDS
ncbi:K02131 F-type H+-transporting ATPase subunit 6 [Scophthalmus maximus]|uniref:ATP synthase peripheral stalk subunit F6, mitochondrial n=1 Tax=Scophthalmus maximus TaxID=52904 RepID=A0A2U9CDC4_SCOMX|nr:K02131 F-type H+-transporting ATPase subunit 6 [Scophthalmus maximus]